MHTLICNVSHHKPCRLAAQATAQAATVFDAGAAANSVRLVLTRMRAHAVRRARPSREQVLAQLTKQRAARKKARPPGCPGASQAYLLHCTFAQGMTPGVRYTLHNAGWKQATLVFSSHDTCVDRMSSSCCVVSLVRHVACVTNELGFHH